jgi:hypothetical protein
MAAITRQAFNPNNYKIVAVAIPIVGYASGTFLSITPNTDISNMDVGTDGEIHTNMIANNTSTAKLRMSYDNPTYQLMRAAAVLYQTTGIFLPSSFVNISDPLDTTFSANSNIIKFSEDNYSLNASDMYREFSINLHNTIRV